MNPIHGMFIYWRDLGFHIIRLAILYKAMEQQWIKERKNFSQWENIISLLTENLLQVPKYKKWNNLEY